MSRRNRNVDVFGGILEASDGEIEAAGVRRNYDDDSTMDSRSVQNSSSKSKVRIISKTRVFFQTAYCVY